MRSHAGVRTDLFQRDPSKVLLTDFFGGVAQAEIVARNDIRDAEVFARTISKVKQMPVEHKVSDGYGIVTAIWTKTDPEKPSSFGWESLGYWRASASIVLMFGLYVLIDYLNAF
jgi:GPI-anchor transamidase subunit K